MWELMIFLKKPCGYTYVSDINPVNILGANNCGTHVHIFVKRMYSKTVSFDDNLLNSQWFHKEQA